MCGVICLWYAVALHKTIFLGKGTNYLQQQINRSSLMLTKHNWPSAGVISLASHIQRTHRLMRFCFILQFKYRPIENFFKILNNTFYFVKSAHPCKLRVKIMPAYIQQVQFITNKITNSVNITQSSLSVWHNTYTRFQRLHLPDITALTNMDDTVGLIKIQHLQAYVIKIRPKFLKLKN